MFCHRFYIHSYSFKYRNLGFTPGFTLDIQVPKPFWMNFSRGEQLVEGLAFRRWLPYGGPVGGAVGVRIGWRRQGRLRALRAAAWASKATLQRETLGKDVEQHRTSMKHLKIIENLEKSQRKRLKHCWWKVRFRYPRWCMVMVQSLVSFKSEGNCRVDQWGCFDMLSWDQKQCI